eukprot:9503914-Pyramimonas_sp.AAC.3
MFHQLFTGRRMSVLCPKVRPPLPRPPSGQISPVIGRGGEGQVAGGRLAGEGPIGRGGGAAHGGVPAEAREWEAPPGGLAVAQPHEAARHRPPLRPPQTGADRRRQAQTGADSAGSVHSAVRTMRCI